MYELGKEMIDYQLELWVQISVQDPNKLDGSIWRIIFAEAYISPGT